MIGIVNSFDLSYKCDNLYLKTGLNDSMNCYHIREIWEKYIPQKSYDHCLLAHTDMSYSYENELFTRTIIFPHHVLSCFVSIFIYIWIARHTLMILIVSLNRAEVKSLTVLWLSFCISFPSFKYSPGGGYDVIWEEGLLWK